MQPKMLGWFCTGGGLVATKGFLVPVILFACGNSPGTDEYDFCLLGIWKPSSLLNNLEMK